MTTTKSDKTRASRDGSGDGHVGLGLVLLHHGLLLLVGGLAAALHAPPSALILAGAIAFILSDSLIGYNRFVQAFGGARESIMVTYYLAQVLLVCGMVRYRSRVV